MFSIIRFLEDNFNSVDGVIETVNRHWPTAPQRDAVRKWFARASISSDWWPILLYVIEKETGRPVSVAAYMETPQDDVFA